MKKLIVNTVIDKNVSVMLSELEINTIPLLKSLFKDSNSVELFLKSDGSMQPLPEDIVSPSILLDNDNENDNIKLKSKVLGFIEKILDELDENVEYKTGIMEDASIGLVVPYVSDYLHQILIQAGIVERVADSLEEWTKRKLEIKKKQIIEILGHDVEIFDELADTYNPPSDGEVFRLEDFSDHKWVSFFVEYGEPYIEFAEGCKYWDLDGIKEFEDNVIEKYISFSNSEEKIIGKKYLEGAELLRSACNLPKREFPMLIEKIDFESFSEAIKNSRSNINKFLNKKEREDSPFLDKNRKWFNIAEKVEDSHIIYMFNSEMDNDPNYYDLLCLSVNAYGEQFNLAIPVPVLVEATGYSENAIFNYFKDFNAEYSRTCRHGADFL